MASSAGIEPKPLSQVAKDLMAEIGVDISAHAPRKVTSGGLAAADVVVTLCDKTRGGCPVVPPGVRHIAWSVRDPGGLDPHNPKDWERLREIRDEIRSLVQHLLATH